MSKKLEISAPDLPLVDTPEQQAKDVQEFSTALEELQKKHNLVVIATPFIDENGTIQARPMLVRPPKQSDVQT